MNVTFHRKNIRLAREHYRGENRYFITICCQHRHRAFLDRDFTEHAIEMLRETAASYDFAIHSYCFMPDHMHVLAMGLTPSCDLLNFILSFKRGTTAAFGKRNAPCILWQKKFYDHILRGRDDPERVAAYIWMNPVRRGLCQSAQEYPFSGSFTLAWGNFQQPAEPWLPSWKSQTCRVDAHRRPASTQP